MTSEFIVATHAVVFLNHKQKTVSSEEIAENVCTNPARVRKVLAKLKKAGLIATKEGAEGGYLFEKDASRVSLWQIFSALGEQIVAPSWKSGNPDKECLIASGMADVMDAVFDGLNEVCAEKLKTIMVADIDRQIFNRER